MATKLKKYGDCQGCASLKEENGTYSCVKFKDILSSTHIGTKHIPASKVGRLRLCFIFCLKEYTESAIKACKI